MKKPTPEQLANKWINMLLEAGYTYDEMLKVFAMAREILEKKNKKQ